MKRPSGKKQPPRFEEDANNLPEDQKQSMRENEGAQLSDRIEDIVWVADLEEHLPLFSDADLRWVQAVYDFDEGRKAPLEQLMCGARGLARDKTKRLPRRDPKLLVAPIPGMVDLTPAGRRVVMDLILRLAHPDRGRPRTPIYRLTEKEQQQLERRHRRRRPKRNRAPRP